MKFSIITATWNAEKYLEECLLSVHNQSFNSEEFEHIIQDNYSTDNTKVIISNFPSSIFVEKDLGQSDAFNKAVLRAKGDYIVLLDADDILMPNTLTFYNAILSKKNIDIIYGNILLIDQNDELIKKFYSVPFNKIDLVSGFFCPPSNGILIKKDCLINNPFDTSHHYNMDTEWFLRCNDKYKLYFLNEFVAKYRFHDFNKTRSLLGNESINNDIEFERNILRMKYRQIKGSTLLNVKIIQLLIYLKYNCNKIFTIISYKIKTI